MALPDIVALLITYLNAQLTPPVHTRVPDPRPDEWLQVRRVGGAKTPPVRDRARLDLLAWADTEPEAMALLLQARLLVNNLARTDSVGVTVYRVEETMGPRQTDDPESGQCCAWMTVAVLFRADDLVY